MKKILLLLAVILTTSTLHSQIINETAIWPDTNWTLSGTYNSVNLLLNPTMGDSNFKFDDAQVSNVGDKIYLEAPTLDLSAAFAGNEKVLILNIDLAFALTASTSETLGLQYWDADASTWKLMPDGQPGSGDSQGTYTTCTSPGPFPIYFDFKNFTANQLSNFKYRFFYDDGGLATGKGLCLAAPTVTSANVSCSAPTALQTVSLGDTNAEIGWTVNNNPAEVNWGIEYGAAGFTLGAGTSDVTDRNPHGINGLTASTSYDFYVRANCIPDMAGGAVYSDWSTKFNFSTTAPRCDAPSGGNAVKVTQTTAEIAWAPQSGESQWNVEYGPVGYTRGSANAISSFVSTTSNSNALTGLTASTSYDFYVQADCGTGSTSTWAGPFTITTTDYTIGWLSLQWPETGAINAGDPFMVYAQIWVDGLTNSPGQAGDITAWIGYNSANTDPSTWSGSNWLIAAYNKDQGNNDEYQLDLGAKLTTAGTYYYASRFQLSRGAYQYGGFQGPWQAGVNNSGVLTVTGTLGLEDQIIEGFGFYPNPTKDNILLNAKQNIDQVELYNLLGQQVMIAQPGVSSYKLNLSSLNTGVYFMKVKVADKTGTYKVVRQ